MSEKEINELVDKLIDLSNDLEVDMFSVASLNAFFEESANAIQALFEEIQQYRAIGTVDQCREAVERMKPKKVIVEKDECISKSVTGDEDYSIKYVCPACGSEKLMRGYPCNCGKILDWSE